MFCSADCLGLGALPLRGFRFTHNHKRGANTALVLGVGPARPFRPTCLGRGRSKRQYTHRREVVHAAASVWENRGRGGPTDGKKNPRRRPYPFGHGLGPLRGPKPSPNGGGTHQCPYPVFLASGAPDPPLPQHSLAKEIGKVHQSGPCNIVWGGALPPPAMESADSRVQSPRGHLGRNVRERCCISATKTPLAWGPLGREWCATPRSTQRTLLVPHFALVRAEGFGVPTTTGPRRSDRTFPATVCFPTLAEGRNADLQGLAHHLSRRLKTSWPSVSPRRGLVPQKACQQSLGWQLVTFCRRPGATSCSDVVPGPRLVPASRPVPVGRRPGQGDFTKRSYVCGRLRTSRPRAPPARRRRSCARRAADHA